MCKLGIVFPGQGSQYVGMGKEFYREFKEARNTFAEAQEVLKLNIAELCLEGPKEDLDLTINTQTAILTVTVAAYRILGEEVDIRPTAMAGHSLGEYSALYAAGAISFADALSLVNTRGKYLEEAVPAGSGCMAAIMGVSKELVESACRGINKTNGEVVELVNVNSPNQFVVAGHTKTVETVIVKVKEKGAKRAIKLPISVPCHCSLLNNAAKMFEEDLSHVEIKDCTVRVIPNYDPFILHSKETTRELLAKQFNSPVRWQETIEKMIEMGIDTIIEIGPKRTLSGLIKRIDKNIRTLNVEDMGSLGKTINFINDL
jgi:[acyl-carrier-protein] S-malonyltransferase